MAIRHSLEEALDSVDAAIFTGDSLQVDEERQAIKNMVERWKRAIDQHEAAIEAGKS